jgi:hypothetical protein
MEPRGEWRFEGEPLSNVVGVLQPILSVAAHEREECDEHCTFRFHPAHGAEYQFIASVYPNGEASVWAELLSDSDAYFWSLLLELADFPSLEALAAELLYRMRTVLTQPSRVVQQRGTLFESFTAEVFVAGEWKGFGGGSALRWGGIRIPSIEGDTRVYHSPALVS